MYRFLIIGELIIDRATRRRYFYNGSMDTDWILWGKRDGVWQKITRGTLSHVARLAQWEAQVGGWQALDYQPKGHRPEDQHP